MKIGFISNDDPERIEFAKTHGFGCVELMVGPNDDFFPNADGWKDKAKKVKTAYDEAGLNISCLAAFYVNHLDPQAADEHAELVRNSILLAREMGVATVGGFSGRLVGKELEDSLPALIELWSEHGQFADDHGVRIAFEHCPMGRNHLPPGGINGMCTPAVWQAVFDGVPSQSIGLEYDPSHLICQFIDPAGVIRRFGDRIYHVHAKDAKVYRHIMDREGIYAEGAIEHCFPGLGDTDWAEVIKELRRAGYHGDLNIEGWHDRVYCGNLEDEGLVISLKHLSQFMGD